MFDKMPLTNVVTWNIMITQLIKMGDINEANGLYSRMPQKCEVMDVNDFRDCPWWEDNGRPCLKVLWKIVFLFSKNKKTV